MAEKKLRVNIESVQIFYDGDEFVEEGQSGRQPYTDSKNKDNFIEVSLEYPRAGAALISTTKQMDLPSRTVVKPDLDNFWESGVFKEVVDSETRLKVAISDKDKRSRFGIWLRTILGGALNLAIDPKTKAITNVFAGAIAGDLQTRLVNGVKGSSDEYSITSLCASKDVYIEILNDGLSAHTLDKDGGKINALGSDGEIKVTLYAVRDFNKKVKGRRQRDIRETGKSRTKKLVTMFKKGEPLGEIVFKVDVS